MKHEIATSMIPWPGKSIICNLRAADQSLTSASAHYWEKLCQLAKIIKKIVIANSWCRVWNRYSKDKLRFRCVDYVFRRILISIGSDHCQPLSGDSLTNSWLAEVQLTFWGWILAKTFRLKFVIWLNIAKGTTEPRHWVLWLIQQFYFKAEASTSFEILVKLQFGFVGQRARKT